MISLLALLSLLPTLAISQEVLEVQTPNDQYKMERTENGWAIDGKVVDGKVLKLFDKWLHLKLPYECPHVRSKPDLVVRRMPEGKVREFFRLERLVREGDRCEKVKAGAEAWPYHRDWFIGDKERKLTLKPNITLKFERSTYEIVRENNQWENHSPDGYPDMSYVRDLLGKVENFQADWLYHPAIKGFRVIHIQNGNSKMRLEQLSEGGWVLLNAPGRWVPSSESWRELPNLDRVRLPNEEKLREILTSKGDSKERLQKFQALRTPEIESARKKLAERLRDGQEVASVRKAITEIFVRNPNRANVAALVDSLNLVQDEGVRAHLTDRLRLLHKDGMVIEATDKGEDVTKKIEDWQKWFKTEYPEKFQ